MPSLWSFTLNRHTYAVAASETNDILALSKMYAAAIEECLASNVDPYKDCACRIIAFQIAFAGGGDERLYRYYQDAYRYCVRQIEQDRENIPKEITDAEPEISAPS